MMRKFKPNYTDSDNKNIIDEIISIRNDNEHKINNIIIKFNEYP